MSSPDLFTSVWNDTEKYLDHKRIQLQDAGYAVTTQMRGGDPAGEILDLASSLYIQIVAMTTHGRTGFARWALGSVAERVIQAATIPVFLIRNTTEMAVTPPARILVPLDGSEFAEQALISATELATRMKSEVLLLNAFDGSEAASMRLYTKSQAELDEAVDQWREEMGAYLSNKAEQLRANGLVVETRLVLGDASVMDSIGLVVMSTHGRTGVQRWVYGSVANKVLRSVDCPLLLVRPPKSMVGEATNVMTATPLTEVA